MANFQTHLSVGTFVSGSAVLALEGLALVPEGQSLTLFALGIAGSLLPDIDAQSGPTGRALFGTLGAGLAFGWTLPLAGRHPALDLALVWFGLFLGVRVLLYMAFSRFTVHRGIWHSWLAAVAAGLGTVNLAYWVLHQPPRSAWVAGFMMALGYLTHLCLDELYSVDLRNVRLRRSFGTALKPFSRDDPRASLAMAAAVASLAWLSPIFDLGQALPHAELVARAGQALDQLRAWSAPGAAAVRGWLN